MQLSTASLLLPGLAALVGPQSAQAQTRPEQASISVRYGDYRDGQPGWDRIRVKSPQVAVQAPIADDWLFDATAVSDSVSGATPRLHTQRSSASVMGDHRNAAEVKVTRYFARASVSASTGFSDEHDYRSRSAGLQGRWAEDDNNRSWTLGFGFASDRIDATSSGVPTVADKHRHTREWQAGVTQVLTAVDIAQFTFTRSLGSGFYNDPYKLFDQRPDRRNASIGLLRWNHHFVPLEATLRGSWRNYRDSFGVRANTFGLEWVQEAGRFTVTPGARYYRQGAARFYFDPVLTPQGAYDDVATIRRAITLTGDKSADQRLAAWGAVTASLQVAYAFTADTSGDVKVERYRQSASLRSGGGSPGLDRFDARFVQLGLNHRF